MTTTVGIDVVAVQRRSVGTLVASQALGALGITIGIATASLLATEISGSEEQAGLAQTFQVLGAAVTAYLLARLMARRGRRVGTRARLPDRRRGCPRRRAGRRGVLHAVAAGGGRDAGGHHRREQRCPVRRYRPRARRDPGARPLHRRLGHHDGCGGRPQPDGPLRRRGRGTRHPRADRAVRRGQRRDAPGRPGHRRPAAPRPAVPLPRAGGRPSGRVGQHHVLGPRAGRRARAPGARRRRRRAVRRARRDGRR